MGNMPLVLLIIKVKLKQSSNLIPYYKGSWVFTSYIPVKVHGYSPLDLHKQSQVITSSLFRYNHGYFHPSPTSRDRGIRLNVHHHVTRVLACMSRKMGSRLLCNFM